MYPKKRKFCTLMMTRRIKVNPENSKMIANIENISPIWTSWFEDLTRTFPHKISPTISLFVLLIYKLLQPNRCQLLIILYQTLMPLTEEILNQGPISLWCQPYNFLWQPILMTSYLTEKRLELNHSQPDAGY